MILPTNGIDPQKYVIVQIGWGNPADEYLYGAFSGAFGEQRCSRGGDELGRPGEDDMIFIREKYLRDPLTTESKKLFHLLLTYDPISEYVRLHDGFKRDETSPFNSIATKFDINDFISYCADQESDLLKAYFSNKQCRAICGIPDHARARQVILQRDLLVGPGSGAREMARLILSALGRTDVELDGFSPAGWPDGARALTDRSMDIVMRAEREDVLLHSHAQKAFAALQQLPAAAAKEAAPRHLPGAIPPRELRFMGETDDGFLVKSDRLAGNILDLCAFVEAAPPRRILDIGCGYGRLAYGLRRLGYAGSYNGFDILDKHIEWLEKNFSAGSEISNYKFDHMNIYNERYNESGNKFSEVNVYYEDGYFDCFASISVFTHLYEDDVAEYIEFLKRFLADGGLWVTTFFCVPSDFSLETQPGNIAYRLVKKVSEHAYIHNPEEPLLAIAYPEDFLLGLFNKAGFEVVAQRKGSWFSAEDATEFQDWFVLRKRPRAALPGPEAAVVCNICGSTDFAAGPYGRLTPQGRLPYCRSCKSLERQRIVRRLLQALPVGVLDWRRCLQFSGDDGIDPHWLRSYELSVYDGENSLDMQAIDRPDGSYDLIVFNHVLEFVPDDRRGFKELLRVLSARGMIMATFSKLHSRKTTQDFPAPTGPFGAWHLFGEDFEERHQCRASGITILAVEEADPCTEVREWVHFFFKNAEDARRVRASIAAWSETATFLT